jgi:hypothetical protein
MMNALIHCMKEDRDTAKENGHEKGMNSRMKGRCVPCLTFRSECRRYIQILSLGHNRELMECVESESRKKVLVFLPRPFN